MNMSDITNTGTGPTLIPGLSSVLNFHISPAARCPVGLTVAFLAAGLALVRCLTVGPPGLWPGFGPGDPPTVVCEAGAGILLDNRNRTQKWDESPCTLRSH